eukprot:scpid103116/ scgid6479/ 
MPSATTRHANPAAGGTTATLCSSTPSLSTSPFDLIKRRVARSDHWITAEKSGILSLAHYRTELSFHPACLVNVSPDLSYTVKVLGTAADIRHASASSPLLLESLENINKLMFIIEKARFCKGCHYEKYQELTKARVDGGYFKGKNNELVAMLEESWVPNRCIRTTVCPMFVADESDNVCVSCAAMDSSLRRALSRCNKRSESEPDIHTPFIHLSREQLICLLRNEVSKRRTSQKNTERLQAAQQRMAVPK